MIYVKLNNNIVINISDTQLSVDYKKTNIKPILGKTLEEAELINYKNNSLVKLEELANKSLDNMNAKYKTTSETGVTDMLTQEALAYQVDNTIATPTIDEWAEAKGRTREEQIAKVLGMIDYIKKRSLLQEISYQYIVDESSIVNLKDYMEKLEDISKCETIECFYAKIQRLM